MINDWFKGASVAVAVLAASTTVASATTFLSVSFDEMINKSTDFETTVKLDSFAGALAAVGGLGTTQGKVLSEVIFSVLGDSSWSSAVKIKNNAKVPETVKFSIDTSITLAAENGPAAALLPSSVTVDPSGSTGPITLGKKGTFTDSFSAGLPGDVVLGDVTDHLGKFYNHDSKFDLSTLTNYALIGGGGNVTAGAKTSVNGDFQITYVYSAVPEISTWAMMALGFAGLGFAGYRGSRKARSTLGA